MSLISRLVLGMAARNLDAKKLDKADFPDAKPGDVVIYGFVGVARENVFWQGFDHCFIAPDSYVFSGVGRCYYDVNLPLPPVGTPIQVVWTGTEFRVDALDVRAEYSFDLGGFLRDFASDPDPAIDRLDRNKTSFVRPNQWTKVWCLAAAPPPWQMLHKLLLVEVSPSCPDDQFSWDQAMVPQQALVLEGTLYRTARLGDTPVSFPAGSWVSIMGKATQFVRTDPMDRTRFLVFHAGPQFVVDVPTS